MSNSASSIETDKLADLLQDLMASFSTEELSTLAFELDVDYESLPAIGKEAKAREL